MAYITKASKIAALSCLTASIGALAVTAACSAPGRDASATATSDLTVSTDLVISQVYGGGGNAGATYKNDYIELFNRGTAAVSLAGVYVQYASANGDFSAAQNSITLPAVMLDPGKYYLIAANASAGGNGVALPTPDLSSAESTAITMSANNGKVAIAAAPLDGCGGATACSANDWIDLVAYGTTSQAEGTATGALTSSTAAIRNMGGCMDSGNNSNDFTVGAPTPRNNGTTAVDCGTASMDAGTDSGTDAGTTDSGTDSGTTTDAGTDAGPKDAGSADAGKDAGGGADAGKDAGGAKDAGGSKDSGTSTADSGSEEEEDAGSSGSSGSSGTSGTSGSSGSTKKDAGKTTTPAEDEDTSGGSDSSCSVANVGGDAGSTGGAIGLAVAALAFASRRRRSA